MGDNNKPKVVLCAIILNGSGEMFLAKSSKWNDKWGIPGGKLEYGEKFEECIRREVKEETNLEVKDIRFLAVIENFREKTKYLPERHFIFIDYICQLEGGELHLNNEFDASTWMAPKEALSHLALTPSTREGIEIFLKKEEAI